MLKLKFKIRPIDYDRSHRLSELIGLYGLDEIGKEEVIIHGQNNEQTQIRAKEGPRNERFCDVQPDQQPNGETLGESTILSKDSTN